jgi:hypothetical protein
MLYFCLMRFLLNKDFYSRFRSEIKHFSVSNFSTSKEEILSLRIFKVLASIVSLMVLKKPYNIWKRFAIVTMASPLASCRSETKIPLSGDLQHP